MKCPGPPGKHPMKVCPLVILEWERKVEEGVKTYAVKKRNFLQWLDNKYELLQFRGSLPYKIGYDVMGNIGILDLDSNGVISYPCTCVGEEAKSKCKIFRDRMRIIYPLCKEAFEAQLLAAKELLKAKRRLSDAINQYPFDPLDRHYEGYCNL